MKFQSKQTKLSDLVKTIQTGFQVRGKSQLDSKGNYKLIQVKDTVRSFLYHIKSKDLDKISIPEKNRKFMDKYLVKPNDILYLSKLNMGAFLYSDTLENTVPMSHFYILRPNRNLIDSYYLCWILNHKFLRSYIKKCTKGTALPFISKEALMNLKIPLPGISVQEKIIDLLKLRAREQEIQAIIDRKKNTAIDTILSQSCLNFQNESLAHKAIPTCKTNLTQKATPTHKVNSSRMVRHSRDSGNPPFKKFQHKQTIKGDTK